jgi:hypothetical protein
MKAMLHTKGALMSIYRCYFHDNRGVTTDWKPVYSDNEAEARLAALDVRREHRRVHKLEVWRDSTCLFYVGRELLNSN